MTLSGVDHLKACGTPFGEESLIWLNGPAQLRDVVAQHGTKATWFHKVSLHINDEQGATNGHKFELIGFSVDADRLVDIHGKFSQRVSVDLRKRNGAAVINIDSSVTRTDGESG
jgi:hypothetical protein